MGENRWTYGEGIRDMVLFLLKRTPIAIALWFVPVYFAIAPLTHLPRSAMLTVLFTVPLGMLSGVPLGYGLNRARGIHGWAPAFSALAIAALVVIGGTAVVHDLKPFESSFDHAIVWTVGLPGAGGAIARFTLIDA